MGAFDYFVAELTCPHCSKVSPADTTTDMQTKMRDTPYQDSIAVGDTLGVSSKDLDNAYVKIKNMQGPEVRVLHVWECPSCDRADNWAVVKAKGGKVTDISNVVLDSATLEDAHYIEWDGCVGMALEVSGEEYATVRKKPLHYVRKHLKKSG